MIMKNKFKLLQTIFLVFILSITAVSATDYYFQIEIDHNFDEDQEVVCDVKYDENERTWVVDDNSNSDDLILEKNFDETIEIDCNSDLDEINLRVYEKDTDDKIFSERYDDTDKFDYELELVDKDDEWFSIKMDQNFNANDEIKCELRIDNKGYDFEFNDDSSSKDLTIERNYKDEISYECDEDVDRMVFKVYDDSEDEIYSKEYEDKYKFDFNIDDLEEEYELKIQLDHDFEGDEITCDLDIKGKDDKSYTFDEDSTNSQLNINEFFIDEFTFDCDSDIDIMNLYIYDENGDKIDEKEFENEDKFDYELKKGEYDFFIQITNQFNTDEEISCDLNIDSDKEDSFDFDDRSSIGDLRLEGQFNEDFELKCDKEMDSVEILIFELDDENNEIDSKSFTNKDTASYSILDDYLKVEPVTVTPEPTPANTNVEEETPIETTVSNSTSGSVQNTNSQNPVEVNSTSQAIQNSIEEEPETTDTSSNKYLGLSIIFMICLVIIFVLFYFREVLFEQKRPKRRNEKVDLDFLKKRK